MDTRTTWRVTFAREPGDTWPDIPDYRGRAWRPVALTVTVVARPRQAPEVSHADVSTLRVLQGGGLGAPRSWGWAGNYAYNPASAPENARPPDWVTDLAREALNGVLTEDCEIAVAHEGHMFGGWCPGVGIPL